MRMVKTRISSEENIMNDFKTPKIIKFQSDLRGIRYKNGKE